MSRSTEHPVAIEWALASAMAGPVVFDGTGWRVGDVGYVTDNGDGTVTVDRGGATTVVTVAGKRSWEYLEAFEVLLRPARDTVRRRSEASLS